ncbi:MAG: zinc ribbon domain-containing protein [Planctomycetota bacterium]|nr:zinc ribbon domain-containing protein [Planctomycetota bacterium]
MNMRAIFVRTLLYSLAATAACAVIAIFAGGANWGWQLTGTAAVLAVASALLTPIGRLGDPRSLPPVATAWASVIVVDTMVAILGIWNAIPSRYENEVFVTALLLIAWLAMALPGLGLAATARQRPASLALVAGATAAILWWDAIAWGWKTDDGERGWVLACAGLLACGAMLRFPHGQEPTAGRVERLLGVALIIIGALWWFAVLPGRGSSAHDDQFIAGAIALTTLATLCIAHRASGLLTGPPLRVFLHLGTLVAMGFLGSVLTIAAWSGWATDRWLGSVAASMGVLTGTGVLGSLILHLFSRGAAKRKPLADVSSVRIECPSCALRQPVVPGPSHCGRCGLGFFIGLQLVRCPSCEYSLAGLREGTSCPECGAELGVRELPVSPSASRESAAIATPTGKAP